MKRLGAIDALSREFARTNSARLWKQLVAPAPEATSERATDGLGAALVIGAIAAAVFQLLRILTLGDLDAVDGADPDPARPQSPDHPGRRGRRVALAPPASCHPGLAVDARTDRRRDGARERVPAVVLPAGAVRLLVVVAHSAIALWLLVGVSYTGASWRSTERRMDFVRFTGECVVLLRAARDRRRGAARPHLGDPDPPRPGPPHAAHGMGRREPRDHRLPLRGLARRAQAERHREHRAPCSPGSSRRSSPS